MKSILLRFPDKVVRYIRGENTTEEKFEQVIGILLNYAGVCGWSRDTKEDFEGIGWKNLQVWEDIKEIKIEEEED